MKIQALIALALASVAVQVAAEPPQAYINEHFGFNVKGYKYSQSEFPCDIDKNLVGFLLEDGKKAGLNMEATSTAKKIRNGVIPVVAIDIEQLVLGSKEHTYGTQSHSTLPKVQVTVAVIKGEDLVTAKHTCAIATLSQLSPSSSVLDLGTTSSVCSVTQRCLRDLSKDIVKWVTPQLN